MNVIKFFSQVKQEFKKVIWPSKKEINTSVLIIVTTVLIFSTALNIVDYGVHSIIEYLLNIGN
ncbi:MAG TPA: preprotein translocase subunit SecE [Candidatus Megaira endosymbiont of Hartmannula sinica]|nr:preprotein translocase subunit SecE [Candidatus Megaera endosymbiont of Hartmannula sinica]